MDVVGAVLPVLHDGVVSAGDVALLRCAASKAILVAEPFGGVDAAMSAHRHRWRSLQEDRGGGLSKFHPCAGLTRTTRYVDGSAATVIRFVSMAVCFCGTVRIQILKKHEPTGHWYEWWYWHPGVADGAGSWQARPGAPLGLREAGGD